jgi:hypothetical protein
MKQIKQLFGNRIAVQITEEEYEGLIVAAPTAMRMHVCAHVVAVGPEVKGISTGDIVFYQKIIHPFGNTQQDPFGDPKRYNLNGVPTHIELAGDMIAKLSSRKVKLENFTMIGDWFLCRREIVRPSNLIIVPDSAEAANQDIMVQFLVEQVGDGVVEVFPKGTELIIDRGRANPLRIETTDFVYIHKNFVMGVLGS